MISKIEDCNINIGFSMKDPAEILLYQKYLYWKQGIPTFQYRKELMKDVKDVLEIDSAFVSKHNREAKIRELMSNVKM